MNLENWQKFCDKFVTSIVIVVLIVLQQRWSGYKKRWHWYCRHIKKVSLVCSLEPEPSLDFLFYVDSSEYTQGALPLGPPLKASGRMKRVWGEVNFMNLGWGSQPHRSTSLSKAPRCLCQSSKNISHTQVKLPAFVRAVGLTSSP